MDTRWLWMVKSNEFSSTINWIYRQFRCFFSLCFEMVSVIFPNAYKTVRISPSIEWNICKNRRKLRNEWKNSPNLFSSRHPLICFEKCAFCVGGNFFWGQPFQCHSNWFPEKAANPKWQKEYKNMKFGWVHVIRWFVFINVQLVFVGILQSSPSVALKLIFSEIEWKRK